VSGGAGGLVPLMALAQRAGLAALARERVRIDHPCGVNAQLKVPCLVAGMTSGADSIDEMDLLRHGVMSALFGGIRAVLTRRTRSPEFSPWIEAKAWPAHQRYERAFDFATAGVFPAGEHGAIVVAGMSTVGAGEQLYQSCSSSSGSTSISSLSWKWPSPPRSYWRSTPTGRKPPPPRSAHLPRVPPRKETARTKDLAGSSGRRGPGMDLHSPRGPSTASNAEVEVVPEDARSPTGCSAC